MKRNRYLGAGIICLLLALVVSVHLRSETSGFSDVPLEAKLEFWQEQANLAKTNLAKEPNNLDSYFRLAIAQAMLGEIDESVRSFEILDKLDKDDSYADSILSRYGDKEEYYDSLLVQTYLAFALYVQEDYPASVEAFNRVIQLDPENPWPLNYQGFSLYKADRLDEAVSVLEKSAHLDPANQYTHALLGMAYYEQGRFFKALSELAKAPKVIGKYFK